jgi:hypothetical protein
MPCLRFCERALLGTILVAGNCLISSCHTSRVRAEPVIEFSRVPAAGDGSPDELHPIEGRVQGAEPGQRIVLLALSGMWWVQPLADHPFTEIQPDSRWRNSTHPGTAYAALLVDSSYRPPLMSGGLPRKGDHVLAVATVAGQKPLYPPKTLQFSGYDWEARGTPGNTGGSRNFYEPKNAWTDQRGFLHLKVAKQADRWTGAEVKLSRSLGYGSYRFVVSDVAHLEPAAVFGLFTWDDSGPPREMDIEISRWGEPEDKNAQFVVQPYVVPANTVRFVAPQGRLTYWIDWQPGRVVFKTTRDASSIMGENIVAEHAFTSGVPSPGSERIHMIQYIFGNKRNPMRDESEVVIEKFEFLP